MSDAPFSMPSRNRRWSFSRSIGRVPPERMAGAGRTPLVLRYRPPHRRLDRPRARPASGAVRLDSRESIGGARVRALQSGRIACALVAALGAALAAPVLGAAGE